VHRQPPLHGILRVARLFPTWPGWDSLFRKFSLYTFIGAAAFSTDYSIFLTVFTVGSNAYVANIFGICCGIVMSFTLNSRYNFQRRDAVVKRASKFLAVELFGMALSSAIIALLIHQSVDPRLGKIVALPVVFVAQFTANAFWTFR
jgi:putative flippase GtrA